MEAPFSEESISKQPKIFCYYGGSSHYFHISVLVTDENKDEGNLDIDEKNLKEHNLMSLLQESK